MAICGIMVVSGSIVVNTLLQSVILQIFTYGILGGVGTSLVLSQAEAVLRCHFPSQQGIVQGVCHSSMALGHFGMPLLLNGLISIYGIEGGLLLQAGVVLQAAIGAALLLPPGGGTIQPPNYGRPRAYSLFDDIELAEIPSGYSHSGHSPLLPQRSWRNPGSSTDSGGLGSPIMQARHKNINGVDILPEIPEESEDSDDCDETTSPVTPTPVLNAQVIDLIEVDSVDRGDSEREGKVYVFQKNKNTVQSASLSKWKSIDLQTRRNSNKDSDRKPNNINNSENPSIDTETSNSNSNERVSSSLSSNNLGSNRHFKSSLPHRISDRLRYYHSPFHRVRKVFNCGCCNWYCRFRFYVAILNFPHRLNVWTLRPLLVAIREPKFFPAFCLQTVSKLSSIMFSVLTPCLVWSKEMTHSFQETAFTVSVAAFTWLCFLLISPCFSDLKPRRQKYLYFLGCIISISGLYILPTCSSQSCVIISCSIFGLGHGAIKNSEVAFLENELGVSKFLMIQGAIDAISGSLVLVIAVIAGVLLQHPNGITHSILVLAALQTLNALLWILSIIIPLARRRYPGSNFKGWPPESDFMTPG